MNAENMQFSFAALIWQSLSKRPDGEQHLPTLSASCICIFTMPFFWQVRLIVERLVRRLDYETVAECMPEDDRKLLAHIKKEQTRKQRKKGESEEGSMVSKRISLDQDSNTQLPSK